ncbi:MAG: hypothetical protein AAF739_17880 [Pseudomonadota bacterium]
MAHYELAAMMQLKQSVGAMDQPVDQQDQDPEKTNACEDVISHLTCAWKSSTLERRSPSAMI